jgi:hypothetical protein
MLYREIIAVCSEIHTKHINTAVWDERIVNVKLVVHIVTTELQTVNVLSQYLCLGKQGNDGNISASIRYIRDWSLWATRVHNGTAAIGFVQLLTLDVDRGCAGTLLA